MSRTKTYIKFEQPIKDVSADVLNEVLGTANNAQIIRTIALNEKEFLCATSARSLRRFWYSTVKPILTKLGKLDVIVGEETLTKWDMELSRHLGDLVKMGLVTYADLQIVDTSRQRECPTDRYQVDRKAFGYQVAGSRYPEILLCTEKDTVYPILRQVIDMEL